MSDLPLDKDLVQTIKLTGAGVLLDIVLCCATMYWLLPKYLLRKKYLIFVTLLLLMSIGHLTMHALYIDWYFRAMSWERLLATMAHLSQPFVLFSTVPVCFGLVAFKLLKISFKKEQERAELTVGNTNAELMLLKAQVHPHFLFNTLNNVYSFTLDHSVVAADLLAKLSHIIRYMTKECSDTLVPLDKELKMIEDYVSLERVRYGQRLAFDIKVTGQPNGKLIAPLLLIPFVENSFKHGASKILERPWIKITISITNDRIFFHVSNSKPHNGITSNKGGIGLKNVERRLQLLYPNTHTLEISANVDRFTVDMDVALTSRQELISDKESSPANQTSQSPAYV